MARRAIPRYENSPADQLEDQKGAGLLGITPAQYEKLPVDRAQDLAGQARLNAATAMQRHATAVVAAHRGGPRGRKR